MSTFRIVAAGDSALVVEFEPGDRMSVEVSARAVAVAAAIQAAVVAGELDGVLDIVPTFRTAAVYFDPLKTDVRALSARLGREAARPAAHVSAAGELHRIPVCYGGSCGPDLAEVASAAGISEDAVVALHSAPVYRVFMLGFLPGFAYMGLVEQALAVPRRATPRASIPAGSVAIAGRQTGIYPSESPGGWHVIGRTPIKPFDQDRAEPFLFGAGDNVQFHSIPCLPST